MIRLKLITKVNNSYAKRVEGLHYMLLFSVALAFILGIICLMYPKTVVITIASIFIAVALNIGAGLAHLIHRHVSKHNSKLSTNLLLMYDENVTVVSGLLDKYNDYAFWYDNMSGKLLLIRRTDYEEFEEFIYELTREELTLFSKYVSETFDNMIETNSQYETKELRLN